MNFKKLYIWMLLLVISGLAWQCSEEDKIDSPLESYRRHYDVNSADPVWKYVSGYYFKYGRVFITDPDSADFVYNFVAKNDITIRMPEQTTDHLLAGIGMMEDLFMDFYPEECIRKHFPNSLILADSIATNGYGGKPQDFYGSRNFMALNIEKIANYSPEQKSYLSMSMHQYFILNFLYKNEALDLTAFFNLGERYYGTRASSKLPIETMRKAGFILDEDASWWGDGPSVYPSKQKDLENWLQFIYHYKADQWSKIPDNVEELLETYPVMKQKFEILTKALKECIGVNYQDLIYKINN